MKQWIGFAVAAILAGGCTPPEVTEFSATLIPLPTKWEKASDESLCITGQWNWSVDPSWEAVSPVWQDWLQVDRMDSHALAVNLKVIQKEGLADEGYELRVSKEGIEVFASTETGAFYGLTTLRWMMSTEVSGEVALPHGLIQDAPRFPHRGLLLDCCRHFMEPEYVKRMIDLLALHKMNVLHWHLTEDQGWRIEIDAYPRLTEIGAWRTEADGSTHGGFYTKDQIRDIVAYAATRQITVIPEIELPGHSNAALAAYPWLGCTGEQMEVPHDWGVFKDIYCAGSDSTFAFLETVLDEVLELFPSEYIHIGGDEAPKVRWEVCPKCQRRIDEEGLHDEHELQSWFIGRIGRYLEAKGRKIIGWDEILEGGLPAGATVQSWRGMEGGQAAIAAGNDAIMSPTSHCYFDYPVESTDLEEVYGFEPVPTDLQGAGRILGGECNMWTERAPQHLVDSKVFPRLVAMSEVLWSQPEQRGWSDFRLRMERHYSRLDAWGVEYGWETVPISMQWNAARTKTALEVQFEPAMSGIEGVATYVPSRKDAPEASHSLGELFSVVGEGEIRVELMRKGISMGTPWTFPVAGHVGAFQSIELDHEVNSYYPGRGEQGLADGRLGSQDFRDGSWQAVQESDMGATIELAEAVHIDSLSMQFYRYQDAWIFLPDSLRFQWSMDGQVWNGDWLLGEATFGEATFIPNESQDVARVAVAVNAEAKWVRIEAVNPGLCPDWHDAASSATWMFLDELVVHTNHH